MDVLSIEVEEAEIIYRLLFIDMNGEEWITVQIAMRCSLVGNKRSINGVHESARWGYGGEE